MWPKLVASVAFLAPPLGWRAKRRYRLLDRVSPATDQQLPSLSIIVPARNEAENLQRLLPSLCALEYPGKLEVIVVDDNSTDQTASVAQRYGVPVISLDRLPPTWYGKPYACHTGGLAAQGDWLLFTDADTIHAPDGPARAVSYALNHDLDGLSTFLQNEFRGLPARLAFQVAFVGLFASLPYTHTVLNGQYILIRREVYAGSGGFAAVRNDPLEDLALGRHLFLLGYRLPMLRGNNLARVVMYGDRAPLWQGMARIGAGTLRWSGKSSLVTALFVTAVMTPLLVLALSAARRLGLRWVLATLGSAIAGLLPWSRGFGSRWHLLLAPVGALFVQLAALWGLIGRIIGRGIRWKGRTV